MIIIGIDPGSKRVGFGIIKEQRGKASLLKASLLDIKSGTDSEALVVIKNKVTSFIEAFSPDAVVVEKLFFSRNTKTAFSVAQARGVIILACAEVGVPIIELSPTKIKMSTTGNGSADKKSVLKMVRLILNEPKLSVIDDVSDAVAAAIAGVSVFKNNKTKTLD